MFSRKRRVDPLPGWGAVRIQSFGWDEVERDERRCVWGNGGDAVSLDFLPAEPTIFRPVGDDTRLVEYFELYAQEAGMAVVEARWIEAPDETPITWSIAKARQSESGHGVVYVGSLIIPFANCSWVAMVQSLEGGPTGAREALWLDRHLASGGTFEEAFPGAGDRSAGDPLPPIRRLPSDDEVWDEMLPSHPLSRVRRLLPQVAASIQISTAAKRLSAFG